MIIWDPLVGPGGSQPPVTSMVDSRHARKIAYKAAISNTPLQAPGTRPVISSTRPACPRQNAVFCPPLLPRQRATSGIQNGGSARGYQELPAPLAIPPAAEQATAGPVFLCIASARRELPPLPR